MTVNATYTVIAGGGVIARFFSRRRLRRTTWVPMPQIESSVLVRSR